MKKKTSRSRTAKKQTPKKQIAKQAIKQISKPKAPPKKKQISLTPTTVAVGSSSSSILKPLSREILSKNKTRTLVLIGVVALGIVVLIAAGMFKAFKLTSVAQKQEEVQIQLMSKAIQPVASAVVAEIKKVANVIVEPKIEMAQPEEVMVEEVKEKGQPLYFQTEGKIIYIKQVPIFDAENALALTKEGEIQKRDLQVGDVVHEGELLAQVDTTEIQKQIEEAKARLSEIETREDEIYVQMKVENVSFDYTRISQPNLKKYDTLLEQIEQDKAAAQERLIEAQFALEGTKLIAPFNGKVQDINIAQGKKVSNKKIPIILTALDEKRISSTSVASIQEE